MIFRELFIITQVTILKGYLIVILSKHCSEMYDYFYFKGNLMGEGDGISG